MALASRITDDPIKEEQNVREYFDSIWSAANDDMKLDYDFSEYPLPYKHRDDAKDWRTQMTNWEHNRLRFFVERRVKELREAIEKNPRIARSVHLLQENIFDQTARLKLTEEQKHHAKDQCDKAIDAIDDKVKDFAFHPLSEALKSAVSRAY